MGFYAYEGVSAQELDCQRMTETGKPYTLRQNDQLRVEMQFMGKGHSGTNSQGWQRSSSEYFKALQKSHPEMFSKANQMRVQNGTAPIVDSRMIKSNPNWAPYNGQPLVHHHIGGDGEAVACPRDMHVGSGIIHTAEKDAGITEKCRQFSNACGQNPDSRGKTPSQLHGNGLCTREKNAKATPEKSGTPRQTAVKSKGESSNSCVANKTTAQTSAKKAAQPKQGEKSRIEAVRGINRVHTGTSANRSQAVKNAASAGTAGSPSAGHSGSHAAGLSGEHGGSHSSGSERGGGQSKS